MSSSALPLYNTDKLIYKSGFFNKFKKTLPIVPWFLRKGGKGNRHLPGSGKLDKHWRVLLQAAMEEAYSGSKEVGKIQLMASAPAAVSPSKPKAYTRVIKRHQPPSESQGLTFCFAWSPCRSRVLPCALCAGEAELRWPLERLEEGVVEILRQVQQAPGLCLSPSFIVNRVEHGG